MPESYDKTGHLYGIHPSGTLGELHRRPGWLWARCRDRKCLSGTPIAIAWAVIRWGSDAPVKVLADSLRCTRCRRLGANLHRPNWMGEGFEPFPVDWLEKRQALMITERDHFGFTVEEWSADGMRLEETVAGAKVFPVAKGAFDALVAMRPRSRILLRQSARVLQDSAAPVDLKVNPPKSPT